MLDIFKKIAAAIVFGGQNKESFNGGIKNA